MSKPSKGQKAKPLTRDQAKAKLPAAEQAMRTSSDAYSASLNQCLEALQSHFDVIAKAKARSILDRHRFEELTRQADTWEPDDNRVRRSRLATDPSVTRGLLEAVANGEIETRHQEQKNTPHNMVLLIGGLARVSSVNELQTLAAMRYLNLYERSQIGGARATDYEQVKVDTSGPKQDQISAAQDDARTAFGLAQDALTNRERGIIDMVVIGGASLRKLTDKLGYKGGEGRRKATRDLLKAVDALVRHFKLDPEARKRAHNWNDGSKAEIARDDDGNAVQMSDVA